MPFPERVRETPNHSTGRTNEKYGVVFHHTAGSYEGAVAWLTNPGSRVSAHVVIAKDGRRTVLAGDDLITWHAGRSTFAGRSGCNGFMLGVEFELTREDVEAGARLTDAQIASALEWLRPRWGRYGWTTERMTHHAAVSPGRKQDLSPTNWSTLIAAIERHFRPGRLAAAGVVAPSAPSTDVLPVPPPSDPSITPPATAMQTTSSKPALKSGTIKSALALILITIWKPLVMAIGALLLLLGIEVDASRWIPYADDGAIRAAEWLAIAKDIALPAIGLLVIRFRKRATQLVSGWLPGGASRDASHSEAQTTR